MKIIAFGCRKNVGKDHAARFFASEYRLTHPGCSVVKRGFADKIKDICYQLYAWAGHKPPEYYENNPEYKDEYLDLLNMTVRDLWIVVGRNMRHVYERTWIDYLVQGTSADLLLIPDLRLMKEVDSIHNRKGFIVNILRPSVEDTSDECDDALINFNGWDATIVNDGDLRQLHQRTVEVCSRLLKN